MRYKKAGAKIAFDLSARFRILILFQQSFYNANQFAISFTLVGANPTCLWAIFPC